MRNQASRTIPLQGPAIAAMSRDGCCPVAPLARELARLERGRTLIHSYLPEGEDRSAELHQLIGDWSPYHVDSFLIERTTSLEKMIKTLAATSPFGAAVQLLLLSSTFSLGHLLMEDLDAIPPIANRLIDRSDEHVRLMAWSAYQVLGREIDDPDLRTLESKLGSRTDGCPPVTVAVEAILTAA